MSSSYDPPLSDGVRKCMKSNKSRSTSPEIIVRTALRRAGYPGYRLNWKKAPGKPDICYPGRKIAIFINGCFWHRCPKCNLPFPKHNSEYWIPKLERNMQRDAENYRLLKEDGWSVVVIWECDLRKNPDFALSEAISILEDSKRKCL